MDISGNIQTVHADRHEEWNCLYIVWHWLTNENCANALDHKNPIWRKHIVRKNDGSDSDDCNEESLPS